MKNEIILKRYVESLHHKQLRVQDGLTSFTLRHLLVLYGVLPKYIAIEVASFEPAQLYISFALLRSTRTNFIFALEKKIPPELRKWLSLPKK